MKSSILLVCVGDRDISLYTKFFREYASVKGEKFFLSLATNSYNERCSRAYSFKIGGVGDIIEGDADLVIALEQLEGVRFRRFGREDSSMIVSTHRELPVVVMLGGTPYPNDCFQKCINDCFSVFKAEEGKGDAFICALALRLLGESESFVSEIFGKLKVEVDINEVFSQKAVKA